MRALGVAVTGSVLGTGLVARIGTLSTILRHLDEVESTVETASKLGNIDIESELAVLQLEDLVLVFAAGLHQVDTRSDVGAILMLLDELERQIAAGGANTVAAGVVGTIDGALRRTGGGGRANVGVPLVAGVAVGRTRSPLMRPAPVGVEHHRGLLGVAARRSTGGEGKTRVTLGGVGTDELGVGHQREEESQKERDGAGHCAGGNEDGVEEAAAASTAETEGLKGGEELRDGGMKVSYIQIDLSTDVEEKDPLTWI